MAIPEKPLGSHTAINAFKLASVSDLAVFTVILFRCDALCWTRASSAPLSFNLLNHYQTVYLLNSMFVTKLVPVRKPTGVTVGTTCINFTRFTRLTLSSTERVGSFGGHYSAIEDERKRDTYPGFRQASMKGGRKKALEVLTPAPTLG
jgi:hypothetical protein